ncbi:tetratricopeptide repeat protein [Solitalea lacus]|uniref:tetratricopeptide repeat protein n=1 Tax=Solitalea lacus TaxID=2911172 RepID=UPI001EDA3EA5|nr:tetratricopeptide repeat protein [Solitalea lacus]UKJ08946.1 tetratricopeptide repeat protein [Solitalea lacus]
MIKKSALFTLFSLLLYSVSLQAQVTAEYTVNETYRKALELFDSQKYAAANELFRQVYSEQNSTTNSNYDPSVNTTTKVNAEYYAAICALELNNKNAESELLSFIKSYPSNPKSKTAKFQIGKVYFKNENYKEALKWFSEVEEIDLNATDQVEYNFKTAYCYFATKDYTKAKANFAKVKDGNNRFSEDATYYYAHIAYINKDYTTALSHLNKVKNSSKYAEIYQFYTAQIFLINGKYDDVIAFTEPILNKGNSKYKAQLHKILGSAYFNKKNYPMAQRQFDSYLESKSAAADQTSQDTYQIGYTFYQNKEYDKAISQLERLIDVDDVYAQYAMQTLGNSFLAKQNKLNARAAFQRGSKLTYDEGVREDCLLNYAKLAYETNFSQQGLLATKEFVSKYPRSKNIDEAKTLLGEILLSSKNYKEALETLESVKKRKENTDLLYQKVAYYRGVEVFNARDFSYAEELFEKSLNNPINGKIEMQALFWKAESLFELQRYDEAINTYDDFLSYPGVAGLPVYKFANYNMGYAYFQRENYPKSAEYFERYINSNGADKKMVMDATLRVGDCFFVAKNYEKALTQYNKVIIAGATGADYAIFQKAMIQGVQNKMNDKIYSLKSLQELYPNSSYIDDGLYEMAYGYFMMNNFEQAKSGFNELIKRFPNSSYVPKAILNLGLVYYNTEDDQNALQAYKLVVNKYPGTPEAKEAVLAIKNIYVDKGNASEFLNYAKNTPGAAISASAQDSISFEAANNLYLKGKCDESIPALTTYIEEFGNGYFINDARFYRAECLTKQKRTNEALADYQFIASRTNNKYTEKALFNTSKIYLDNGDLELAKPYLKRLESADFRANYGYAIVGLMKISNAEENNDSTLYYANKVIGFDKMPADEISAAHLFSAKAYMAKTDTITAVKSLGNVSAATKSVYAAEAKYLTALIQYNKGQFKQSQKNCFEVIDNLANHDYWVAKSFLLLADNYFAQGDTFQAKSTLQSIIDNYEGSDDILPSAKEKLAKINRVGK